MYIRDMLRAVTMKRQDTKINQLYTPWGEALDPAHVLEEYPRPQLRRGNYTILNGYWDCAFTDASSAFPSGWQEKILVPFSPESLLSGVGRGSGDGEEAHGWKKSAESLLSGVGRQLQPDEALWYQRTISVAFPHPYARLLLHFGAVDQDCVVYVNGNQVGIHSGGYLSFSFDITEAVTEGENLLTVRVRDISDTSYRTRGKQRLDSGGIFYTAQSGIWQTVWMEYVPPAYVESLEITPLLDEQRVRIEAVMNRPAASYRLEIRAKDRTIVSQTNSQPDFNISLPELHPWTPETPFLYTFTLLAGEDQVESYFALRCVSAEQDEKGRLRLCLNHQPIFMNGVLDQGYWSDGLMTAPSDEALIYDIETMKKLGFNLLRKHAKVECMRWYYHCDRLGMLVWQDMPNGGTEYDMHLVSQLPTLFPHFSFRDHRYEKLSRKSPDSRKEWKEECTAMIRQLYNCPSVVAWVLFNEGWGQFDAADAAEMARRLDPTRLIDAASGWFDQDCGDILSVHNYFRRQSVRSARQRAFAISEFGGYTCHVEGHSYSGGTYGYRIYADIPAFQEGYHRLLEREIEPLKVKGLSAAIYTQLSDVEEETNGILTYDRKVCKL